MRVVVQRCSRAKVIIDDKVCGNIDKGLVLLVGFTEGDSVKEIEYMVDKVINLRIFNDDNGVMNLSLLDIGGSILSVSQFTLYGDANKGRRPSYIKALGGDKASELYDMFNQKLREKNIKVECGIFGADMKIDFINDGPVTILLERKNDNEKE